VSIGEALAAARRRAGLTVTEVSQRTRIRETIITGIEADDYSACGGDFYARGHIRGIARVVGADPEPLIREYDAARLGPHAITEDVTEPVTPIRVPGRRGRHWIAALGLALLVALGFVTYHLLAGSRTAVRATPAARARPATQRPVGHRTKAPAPAPTMTTPSAIPARALSPARAAAFGPYGSGQGDSPQLAQLAIDGNPATAWHTDWYTTARLGNLYPGTGLLVDMGRRVTITAAQLTLGRAQGADIQLRVGSAPALADLQPVARAVNAAHLVRMRPTTPAHGRYVLIWFTRLPPDPAGTFQASVYALRLDGRA
jgi:cytoskeletal protein RodZ